MHGEDPYGDWRDSECAGFIHDIVTKPEERDAVRLIFADWLEEKGDKTGKDKARWFRDPKGYWKVSDTGLVSWNVPIYQKGDSGIGMPMHWVGWNWQHPTREWLESDRCLRLVRAWESNYCSGLDDYPWARGVLERGKGREV